MKRSFLTLACLGVCFAVPSFAGNLLQNGSFENGVAEISYVKFLRPDANRDMIYEGPRQDKSEKVSGAASLFLPNRFAEACELETKSFRVKPDSEYTFSFSIKSSCDQYPFYVSVVSQDPWFVQCHAKIDLGTAWRRHSLSFKTSADPKLTDCHLRMLFGVRDKPTGIWLDDLQIDEGGVKNYAPSAPLESVLDIPELPLQAATPPATGTIRARLRSYVPTASVKGCLRFKATETNGGEAFFSSWLDFSLAPDGEGEVSCEMSFPRFGIYKLEQEIAAPVPANGSDASLAFIGKYQRRPLDFSKDFCLAFNCDSMAATWIPGWGHVFGKENMAPGIRTGKDSGLNCERLVAQGVRLLRLWDKGVSWHDVEPKEGAFDWRGLDSIMKFKTKYGFEPVLVLGGMDFVERDGKNDCGLPAWLKVKCKVKDSRATERKAFLPPLEYWRRYASEFAKHAKGCVVYYEIMNEPNIIFPYDSQEDYLPYLNAAYEELKAADPSCKVIGVCTTSDFGLHMMPFCETCFKNGGLKHMDAMSFHPYGSPELSSKISADVNIAAIKNLLKDHGAEGFPVWNTELYYLKNAREDSNWQTRGNFETKHAVWRFLVDLGEGISQSATIHMPEQIFGSVSFPGKAPHPAYVACNALARYFEGATPLAKIKREDLKSVIYIYKRTSGPIAAAWDYADKENVLEFKSDTAKFKIVDVFGNEEAFPSDGRLALKPEPVYVIPSGRMEEEDFLKAMKEASTSPLAARR